MRRSSRTLRGIAAAAIAAVAAAQHQEVVLGILRDPAGAPVPMADLRFLPATSPDLLALRDLLPPAPPVEARSDRLGAFRIPVAAPGLLLATTPKGLGAAVAVVPGRPVRVALQPMAAVTLPGDPAAFTLWPACVDDDTGQRSWLPPQTSAEARLPPGVYEVWFCRDSEFGWQRLQLGSGQRQELAFGPGRLELRRFGDHIVHPAGFPHLELLGPTRTQCTLRGDARLATLTALLPAGGTALPDALPPLAASGSIPWPPVTAIDDGSDPLEIHCHDLGPEAMARVFLFERRTGGRLRMLARGTTDRDGRLSLPAPSPAGDQWLLAVAAGRAPWTAPRPAAGERVEIAFATGRDLHCQLFDERGSPAPFVAVEFEPAAGSPATVAARSDELGRIRLPHVDGPGLLHIVSPDHANAVIEVPATGGDDRRIDLQPGAVLRGRAILSGGQPASGVVVTLRDPTGRLRPAERSVLTASDGSFSFRGLPQDRVLVVHAQSKRGGLTWSAQVHAMVGNEIALELRCEDPQLLPPDRKSDR